MTTDERAQLKQLQRENFELKRANEILKKAAAFFAQPRRGRQISSIVSLWRHDRIFVRFGNFVTIVVAFIRLGASR